MWWPYVSGTADVTEAFCAALGWSDADLNVPCGFPATEVVWNWLLTPWLQLFIAVVNSSLSLLDFALLATEKWFVMVSSL